MTDLPPPARTHQRAGGRAGRPAAKGSTGNVEQALDLPPLARLHLAADLDALIAAADAAGLGEALDSPPGLFLETLRLDDKSALNLERLLDADPPASLRELLTRRAPLKRIFKTGGLSGLCAELRAFLEQELAATAGPATDSLLLETRPAALSAWAQSRGLSPLLERPAALIDPDFARVEAACGHRSSPFRVGEVLSAPIGPATLGGRSLPAPAKQRILDLLRARAALQQSLLPERQGLLERRAPEDPLLAPLFLAVQAERLRVLPAADRPTLRLQPGPLPDKVHLREIRPGSLELELPPAPPFERCPGPTPESTPGSTPKSTPGSTLGSTQGSTQGSTPGSGQGETKGHSPRLTVSLQPPTMGPCACGVADCPYRCWAMEAVMAHLLAPSTATRNLLQRPSAAHTLDFLDALEPSPAPTGPLGWLLARDEDRVVVAHPIALPDKGRAWRKIDTNEAAALPLARLSPADRTALQALLGVAPSSLPPPARRCVGVRQIAALAGHPHVYRLESATRDLRSVPILAGTLGLVLRADGQGGAQLEAELDGELQPMGRLADRLGELRAEGSSVLVENARLVVVAVEDRALTLLSTLALRGAQFPPDAVDGLLDRLDTLDAVLPVTVGPDLQGEEVGPETTPRLLLNLLSHPDGPRLRVRLRVCPLRDARPRLPGIGPSVVYGRDAAGDRAWCARDREGELENARTLAETLRLDPQATAEPWTWLAEDPEEALGLVHDLEHLSHTGPRWFDVVWDGERPQVVEAGPQQLQVQVHRRHAWFGVGGDISVDGVVLELDALLAAVHAGRRYLQLDGQRWARLSDSLRAALTPLSAEARPGADGLVLSPLAEEALAALNLAGARLDLDPACAALRDRIRSAGTLDTRPPSGLIADLRAYQVEGQAWMARLAAWGAGGVLADDMGLGKTLQTITLLLRRASLGPCLVLAPTSVETNWLREIERFAPSLRPSLLRGRPETLPHSKGTVLIASYGLMVRDLDRLRAVPWATLVLDEAHAIKNPDAARTKAARQLPAEFRLALTGTPVENQPVELWSLFDVVLPGLLGSQQAFRDDFLGGENPEQVSRQRATLARILRPFLLRRTRAEVLPELPPREERTELIPLSGPHRARYEAARLDALGTLATFGEDRPEQRRLQVLAALTRLRLLACHPALVEPAWTGPVHKTRRLLQLAAEVAAEGRQALIFSQFTRHLDLVGEALRAEGHALLRLDGSTPPAARMRAVDAFQAGEAPFFLISLAAGGAGLNLTAASVVIHLDPWWNPAVEDQATGRAHRMGQRSPVTVIRLAGEGTVEEAVLDLHADKRAMVASLLEGTHTAASLDTAALAALVHQSVQRDS